MALDTSVAGNSATQHRSDHDALHTRYNGDGARVALIANQSIPDTTWDPVEWGEALYDDNNYAEFVTNPSRFTVAETGRYELGANIVWTAGQFLYCMRFTIENTGEHGLFKADGVSSGVTSLTTLTGPIYLQAGWWVDLQVLQNSGGAHNIIGHASDMAERSCAWIRRVA